ncbi:MAG TPA: hypothetical protein ENN13_04580 [Candidatus Altiarchaeales archaeon]|nr:hypothetical protein [Candidatus Altiarchaeales archaeon]
MSWRGILLALIFVSGFCSAALEVSLTAGKEEYYVGESLKVEFEMNSGNKVTGQVEVYNLDSMPKTRVRELFSSLPPNCRCNGDERVSGYLQKSWNITLSEAGNYQVRGYFREDDGDYIVEDVRIRVLEKPVETTTTTTLKKVLDVTSTTINVVTTTSTTSTTSSTTTTTTIPECAGCWIMGECVSRGGSSDGMYCATGGAVLVQQNNGGECANDFECRSSLCIFKHCRSENIVYRLLNWLGG